MVERKRSYRYTAQVRLTNRGSKDINEMGFGSRILKGNFSTALVQSQAIIYGFTGCDTAIQKKGTSIALYLLNLLSDKRKMIYGPQSRTGGVLRIQVVSYCQRT